ncbi:MAG: hypothetical protein IJM79_08485 [Erysipelotrichaceae bacterium]|nr:hypothetical protein [Erysipelotrichaceae bacterium]
MDNSSISLQPRKRKKHLYISIILAIITMVVFNIIVGWPQKLSEWMICGVITLLVFLVFAGIQMSVLNSIAKKKLRDYQLIQKGMSPFEVVEIMGYDFVKSFDKNSETYVWALTKAGHATTTHHGNVYSTTYISPRTSNVAVKFEDNKVVSVKAHNV